ncbi:unnamed protein product [Rotaria magnacalcarata]|uniref:MAPEG family protein n=4 Tax=Rotaria magnacalcarata TaxID=392030 RepID=A0A816TEC7_9BILA|nr:unnamed protein product [Rotaria magnacalcarata]CAF1334225.1 unnamed protein product [Rotaria magnacalcarata]CAF1920167.1 unnamed protein product [Rotaria magnacalcarata]CAF2095669.1 unnamed protein product [Rotaria magnacalcarata]CAF2100310.1 unnamed protein product [Rotaria magnacalcarata]
MPAVNEMKIVVGEGYAWILLEAVLICIHMWITGMMMGSVRRRFFNKQFYEKKFPQYKQLGKVMRPDGGYPDDGQGRLADQLDDEDWFTFNNYRRAHMNYMEGGFAIIVPLLIAGLSYTRWAFFTGIVYIVAREIYSQGYRRSGSKGRLIGAILLDLALLILWSMALYTCFRWGNGVDGLKRLIF